MNKILGFLMLLIASNCFGQQKPEQENFTWFLMRFLSSEDFQLERIIFPIEFTYYDPSAEVGDDIKTININRADWKIITDVEYLSSEYFRTVYDNFEAELRDSGERVFAYEGNETGLAKYYYFKLLENKWFLIKMEDYSD